MKLNRKIITPFLVVLTLVLTMIFPAYAWFDNTFGINNDILGRVRVNYTSYFAGGTGTEVDPFIIAEPEQLSNLAYLQNLGKLQSTTAQYYFKVADPDTGNSIDIDFTGYNMIPPIGDHIYPFIGYFDGNYSNLKYLNINGYGKQDIGVFGFIAGYDSNSDDDFEDTGDWEASVNDLFMEEPVIHSNPSSLDFSGSFHAHNDDIVNRATGYIAGHLGMGAALNDVFVATATIDSLLNLDLNRSQYGLIGYNESDRGNTAGSPRNSYSFALNANSAHTALAAAKTAYGTYYINGGSTTRLNDVLYYDIDGYLNLYGGYKNNNLNSYTLSTLKISQTPNDTNAPYLYDIMEVNGMKIETLDSEYSRENIDIVGLMEIMGTAGSRYFGYEPVLNTFTSPSVGSYFNDSTYDHSLILYVKPTNNPNNMGTARISGDLNGSGQLGFYPGFDQYGNYIPNEKYLNKNDLSLITGINVDLTLSVYNAFAAVVRDPSPTNPERLRVINPAFGEWPDFYVFVIGTGNGFVDVTEISFEYKPAALESSQMTSIQRIDFIHKDKIPDVITDLLDPESDWIFSMVNFGYDLSEYQKLEVITSRTYQDAIEIWLDYDITDSSYFYFDILNVEGVQIIIYVKDLSDTYNQIYIGGYQIVETVLSLDPSTGEPSYIVTYYNNTT